MSSKHLRRVRMVAGLVMGAGLLVLTGCNSQTVGGGDPPSAPAPPAQPASGTGNGTPNLTGGAHLSYSGAESGSAQFDGSTCTVSGDKLVSFKASGDQAGTGPGLTGALNGQNWKVTFGTAEHKDGYTQDSASGITTEKKDGVWRVVLGGVQLDAAGSGGQGAPLRLSGTVVCRNSG
ncbi:hypothetical protein ACIBCA_19340 [Kitasatospora sp. NPDC051170]|uniref:hypothetical protein n=1 Tax=Kitasatospora sp. NPDC051170 TaxID=3364056 RepID=UPI0037A1154D